MKRQSIFIGTIITFYSTACSTPSIPTKTALTQPKLVQKEEQGGNPEVYNIHQCLKLKNRAEIACLNKLFPHKTYLVLHPSSGEPLILAGRGDSVDKRNITLNSHDEKFIIYLDTLNIKGSLTSNIKTAQYAEEKNSLVISIPVKDIDKKIILTDSEGHLVLDYTIVK